MKKQKVTITIGIPTFNRLPLLKKTLASVFAQKEPPDEIIVLDNASTDGTFEYLKTLKNIKVFRQKSNIGSYENMNQIFQRAKSDYVISLNSDDLLLPLYIKVLKNKIEKTDKDVVAFMNAGYMIDGRDRFLGVWRPLSHDMLFTPPDGLKNFFENFFSAILLTGWTVYKKSVFKKIGYFDRKYNRTTENEQVFKILPYFPVYYNAEPLFALRIHEAQGFEKVVGDTGSQRIYNDISDTYRILYDYELNPDVKSSLSKKDQKNRILLRKPIAYLIPLIFYSFITLQLKKGLQYLSIFLKYYPKPYFSVITIRQVYSWTAKLIHQWLSNGMLRLKYGNKTIFQVYKIKSIR